MDSRKIQHGMLAVAGILCVLLACLLSGCSNVEKDAHLSIASLKGPTSIGLATLYEDAQKSPDESLYSFDIEGTADAIVPLIVQGKIDIALIPANLAATLYQKTNGAISVIDVNTLGVLYAVGKSNSLKTSSITSIEQLRGATVYMTGKNTVPQYTLDALLAACGLSEQDLTIEFKSEPAEVIASLALNQDAIGILPQPYAAAALAKDADLEVLFDLTEQWDSVMGADSGKLLTGVTVVRNEVLQTYPNAVKQFLHDHAQSVSAVNNDPQAHAQTVVDMGIVTSVELATKAIPLCKLVCLTGTQMKQAVSGYLGVLASQNAASIGGALPGDDFYYIG